MFIMRYRRTALTTMLSIENLITMHYFEFGKYFRFRGESHDFWELLYVDKGDLEVWGDERCYRVSQGSIIFHKPNEFHKFHAENGKAPNVIVLTFDCASEAMKRFENAVILLHDEEREQLAKIIEEGADAFGFPFKYPLTLQDNAPVGAIQMLKLRLEMLLIQLLRRDDWSGGPARRTLPAKKEEYDELTRGVIELLKQSLGSPVSLDWLCGALNVSKTRLKDVFKQHTGYTVMDYFAKLRMEQAKLLIRESTYNFTEIAALLGFSTVHVFSKAFKRYYQMSPSEYANSVRGLVRV
ncbi:AraC family transcriptional regulator [Paenibacillus ginsengarvi]|uniref:AraC family transcriptional regulator n=2 Tax=Paenibacillus ginsengarvi TaxID=400777 RepID=A0A3B0AYR6_9BACL|nr:AraC family transcriptional regulator [Paenibacillus ginsengarvi]